MATSGTATFNLDIHEICEEAYERAGTQMRSGYDLRSARRKLNLMASEWANRGLNLWTVEEKTITIVPGTQTYTLPSDTVDIIEAALRITSATGVPTDYNIERMGVGTWNALTNKTQTGRPLQYFVERTITPSVRIWPSPDTLATYTLVYWRLRRIQDAGGGGTTQMDIPHRFLPAIIAGLAYYIAMGKQELMQRVPFLKQEYENQFQLAYEEDRDRSSLMISPMDLD